MMKYSFLACLLWVSLVVRGGVIAWKSPEGFSSEKYYRVKVNGIPVEVYDTPIASYLTFDFTGEVTVEVETMFDVRWVDIRPLRTKLIPEYTSAHSFRFKLKNPENLSVELNGRIRQQPLFVFAGTPESDVPLRNDPSVVWFEGGKLYQNVALELKDNQTVYIEGGAVVQGCLFAEGKKNIRICGRGILDGSLNRSAVDNNHRFIQLKDCENAKVEDVILHNGTTWQVALFHCNQAIIKGVRIVSESGGDDGMDIFRCTNVIVEGVFAHTKDDCIAIKSGGKYPEDHPTDNILVKNCVFWNSIWGNAIEIGFELYSNEVKNIRFENIDVIHVEDGAVLSIHNAGPAHVHHVVFDDIRVEDSRQKLIDVVVFFSQWSPDGNRDQQFVEKHYLHGAWDGVLKIPQGTEDYHRTFRGKISQISFRNIQVIGGGLPFSVFHGFDIEKNISAVSIENLTFMGKRLTTETEARIRLTHTENFTIH